MSLVLRGGSVILQDFDGAFELHSARALDQDHIAGLQILRRATRPARFGIGQEERGDSAPAGRGGQVLCIAAHADHEIDAGFGCGLAAGRVQLRRLLAQFEHFAGDQDAALRRTRGQRVNHGAQRFGVGVVAVVENGGAGDLAAPRRACLPGVSDSSAATAASTSTPASTRDGEAGHRILRIVRAQQMEGEIGLALAGADSAHAGRSDLPRHRESADRRTGRRRSRRPCRGSRGRTARRTDRSS